MVPDWLWASGLTGLITGAIAYGGMRMELRWLHDKILDVSEAAKAAHKRMDDLMSQRVHDLETRLREREAKRSTDH